MKVKDEQIGCYCFVEEEAEARRCGVSNGGPVRLEICPYHIEGCVHTPIDTRVAKHVDIANPL